MNWNNCFSEASVTNKRNSKDVRSHFQRDYDRLIFSSAFRRLQSKTQVFPLPGSKFVHNRLTHSLEVASVGRSLGAMVGDYISKNHSDSLEKRSKQFYQIELSDVISAACLAHDVGNPAFGHSGEKAISNYFIQSENHKIEGETLRNFFDEWEWSDLCDFEGNANALRVLSQHFKGKSKGGLGLTVTTLASLLKYPCRSLDIDKQYKHRSKYGYFKSEAHIFKSISEHTHMITDNHLVDGYYRHPYVLLVEAADDICYSIIDMEDAHRLGILSSDLIKETLLSLLRTLMDDVQINKVISTVKLLTDKNEMISFLRAKVIGCLVPASAAIFVENEKEILKGSYNKSLINSIKGSEEMLKEIETLSISKIYRHRSVIEIEIAGYNVLFELLKLFVPAALKNKRSSLEKNTLSLIPTQFQCFSEEYTAYQRVRAVIDHIASMTDIYATELYRKLKGIEISGQI